MQQVGPKEEMQGHTQNSLKDLNVDPSMAESVASDVYSE